jgi:hypothetical protein
MYQCQIEILRRRNKVKELGSGVVWGMFRDPRTQPRSRPQANDGLNALDGKC